MCEISALVQKIEQISKSDNSTLNNLKQNDNRNAGNMLENNISFLQPELWSKDELIKPLREAQPMVLETISKQNQFKKKKKNLSNVQTAST